MFNVESKSLLLIIEIIIIDQVSVSRVAKTLPRNSFATCFSNSEKFSTELTATAARESPMKKHAVQNCFIWLNTTYAPPCTT